MMRPTLKAMTAIALLLTLPSCVSLLLGTKGSPPRYALESVSYTPAGADVIAGRLIIDDPRAEAVFDTALIARAPSGQRYEYFEKAEWADRVPRLFGNFIERSFQNVQSNLVIGDRTDLLIGDYILQIDIRGFHIDQSQASSVAEIAYYARLLDSRNTVLAARLFKGRTQVLVKGMAGDVAAFNISASVAGQETIDWVFGIIGARMTGEISAVTAPEGKEGSEGA